MRRLSDIFAAIATAFWRRMLSALNSKRSRGLLACSMKTRERPKPIYNTPRLGSFVMKLHANAQELWRWNRKPESCWTS